MSFSGSEFLLYFLPVFLLLYWMVPKHLKNAVLLLGSLIAYGGGNMRHLGILLISVVINYLIGRRLEPQSKKERRKRGKKNRNQLNNRDLLFFLALAGNVLLLVWFKVRGNSLPIGLSFFTFQVISYLTDVYRGQVQKEANLFRFANYMMMFPQLASGPIVEYGEVWRELKERRVSEEGLQGGMQLFTLGLAAKVLLADTIGVLWQDVQVTGVESISMIYAWMGAFAYSMMLYLDFYGYSLMAIGLGRMIGFELPENFHLPYLARSVKEFYRRWHITLGRWFLKYIYIPLGGSRKGEIRTIANLCVVWILTGFWHGVGWNYLIWAMFLCGCIIMERFASKLAFVRRMRVLPHLYLWVVIPISWICFAVTDLGDLRIYLLNMLGLRSGINVNAMDWLHALDKFWLLLLLGALACVGMGEKMYRRWQRTWWMKVFLAVLFWLCIHRVLNQGNNPFLYLKF